MSNYLAEEIDMFYKNRIFMIYEANNKEVLQVIELM